ncbi:hypothetical protein [Sphingomonas sp.]|jgi:hypothetical protein|uniref:hypothetical protein n=1 Tax=Sphingomonas sp. TaxID=28214 RepID=UPI002ED95A5D
MFFFTGEVGLVWATWWWFAYETPPASEASAAGAAEAERTGFAVGSIAAIRRAVRPGFPVAFRFSQFKQQDYSVRLAETPQDL